MRWVLRLTQTSRCRTYFRIFIINKELRRLSSWFRKGFYKLLGATFIDSMNHMLVFIVYYFDCGFPCVSIVPLYPGPWHKHYDTQMVWWYLVCWFSRLINGQVHRLCNWDVYCVNANWHSTIWLINWVIK